MVQPAPPRSSFTQFARNLRHYQLAGHSPDTPWWVTPVAIAGFIAAFFLILALAGWMVSLLRG